ncbi:MAG: YkgJ family cysteine cluster protein [Desulfurivibrio sp.]|nr:YkgJ family cysteine cluster protein [Desulfurivibrio sp.]
MRQNTPDKKELQAGARLLARPLLPLVRLVQLLYLTSPFSQIEELLVQLREPLTTAATTYSDPYELLLGHLDLLRIFEELKKQGGPPPVIVNEAGEPLSTLEAVEYQVCHAVVERELEEINSLLCAPCHCSLCCTGPEPGMKQEFFEIPLEAAECQNFPLPRVDTPQSRQLDSNSEPPLQRHQSPFYRHQPALYHWRHGWSMILPSQSRCPQLDRQGGCRIYPRRPAICRRPQIFSYLLGELAEDREAAGTTTKRPTPRACHKLLAVWDCPYVRALQDEIADFATKSGLQPIFSRNKF